MKRLIFILLIACLVFSATACNREVKNKEFDEFSQRVLAVFEDFEIETGNEKRATATSDGHSATFADGAKGSSARLLSAKSSSSTFSESKGEIYNLLNNSEHSDKDLKNSIRDAFEQTFYFPLVMGRALKDSLKVKTLYGEIACIPNDQFIVINKNGTHTLTQAYVENAYDGNGNHRYVAIDLDFTDKDNYEFIIVAFSEDGSEKTFYYGNSNREFMHFYIGGVKTVEYRTADGIGYVYPQENLADTLLSLVSDEFTKYGKSTFASLKANCKHTISEAAYTSAAEYYFGYTGPTTVSGLVTEGDCALRYIATNNEETVTLPSNVRYLSFDFSVDDRTGNVKNLVIPSNVKGVKANGNTVDTARLELRLERNGRTALFKNITVEDGSTAFKADGFKLTTYNGKALLYIMGNNETDNIDLTACTVANPSIAQSVNLSALNSVKTFRYNLLDIYNGGGEQFDLLQGYFAYCQQNGTDCRVNFTELSISNVKSNLFITENIMDLSRGSSIDKLILSGDIYSLYVTDENGVIKDIEVNSSGSAEITGVLNGVSKIDVYQNGWVGFSSEYVKEVIFHEGVTSVSIEHLSNNKADTLTVYLPSTLKSFTSNLPSVPEGCVGSYKIVAKMSVALIDGSFSEVLRNSPDQWVIEYDMSDGEKKILNDFKMIRYEETLGGLTITNYYGTDSVIYVPESIAGIPVKAFTLNNWDGLYEYVGQKQTISTVKEVHLPSSLTTFSVSNHYESYNENYRLDAIYYDGTCDSFGDIFPYDTSYLFENGICEQLICEDKTLTEEDFPTVTL